MRSIRTFFIRFASRAWRVACLAMLAIALFPALAGAVTISSGHSGMWYNPARSGEGLQLEILSPDVALVEWYTYDAQGKQRWIQGVGQIAGNSIQFPQMYTTQGGKFGAAFNPDDVKKNVVGNLSLTFGDCNTGTFKYTAFGQSQTLPIQRLTQTMGAGCQSINGVPGHPVMSYAGQSGSWYNTTRSGEGFDLQWLASGQAMVTWYTYDTAGNQAWLLGVGSQQGNAIVFDQMAITNGPKFGTAFDTTALQQSDWGSLTLTLDCNGGTAHYASKQAAFGSGDLTLTRLTQLQQPACPYVAPKFSDLYSVTWDELPIESGTPTNPNTIFADSIADDGTVAGRRNGHLVLWHPDSRTWEDVSRQLAENAPAPVFISPDGSSVIATDASNPAASQALLWQRSTDWQALAGNALAASTVGGVAKNFQFIAGSGSNGGEPSRAWIRSIDGVQNVLPTPAGFIEAYGNLVSDDGKVVIGGAIRSFTLVNDWPVVDGVAVRWLENGTSSVLRSPAGDELRGASDCNADCSLIYGNSINKAANPSQSDGTPWFLRDDGAFGNLGTLADAYPSNGGVYSVSSTSSDGSIAAGNYLAIKYLEYPDSGLYATRAFVWTQATGMVSVRSLAAELGIGDDDWQEVDTVRLSPDGLHILISGTHMPDLTHSRAVVLRLTPKASAD